MKPRYKHSYTQDVFLGHWKEWDLYVCEKENLVCVRKRDGKQQFQAEDITYIKAHPTIFEENGSINPYQVALGMALRIHETDPSVSPNARAK